MATVTDWIKHLTTDADGSAVGTQVQGAIYPGVGSEGILVLLGFVIWIGWHVIAARQESEKLSKLARRRPGSNAWKSNVTDG
jgi:hypothetical protein|tara:strand:+ start:368 stop:613 length:246 start_codon:yes stop_codon:yes gene_type:complete